MVLFSFCFKRWGSLWAGGGAGDAGIASASGALDRTVAYEDRQTRLFVLINDTPVRGGSEIDSFLHSGDGAIR